MLVKLAWRNIWRNKSRSGVIIASVAFGLWAGIFMQGYLNGMVDQRIRTAITKELAHLQIHHPEFRKNYEQQYVIKGSHGIASKIESWPSVKAVTQRTIVKGMISSPSGSGGVTAKGIDPTMEDSVSGMSHNVIDGAWFPGKSKHEIVVGERLLKKYKLKLNSKVVLTLVDSTNTITAGAFRIKGIYRTENAPLDESVVFVDRKSLTALTSTGEDANEIAVLLFENDSVDAVQGRLQSMCPTLETQSWRQLAPEMDLIVSSVNQSMIIFMAIIMLALAFGIINTMLMAVLERTREIGMIIALGMNRAKLFSMIFLETTFLILTGLPVGFLAGYITITYFGHAGIHMTKYSESLEAFGYSTSIYTNVKPGDYVLMIVMIAVTVIISALFPARKALSMNPADAIRK